MSSILEEIETQIAGLKTTTSKSNVGVVRETGDGVARIEGLSDVMLNEMIEFSSGVFGLALTSKRPKSAPFFSATRPRSWKAMRLKQPASCSRSRWAKDYSDAW